MDSPRLVLSEADLLLGKQDMRYDVQRIARRLPRKKQVLMAAGPLSSAAQEAGAELRAGASDP